MDRTWRYATTRYTGTAGLGETIAELADVVAYQDRWTQANSTKRLA